MSSSCGCRWSTRYENMRATVRVHAKQAMYSYTPFSRTHNAVIVFSWMVETTSETMNTQSTNNDSTVVTFTSGLIICWTLLFSSSSYQTPDCFLNCIPEPRTDCYTRTFLQAQVLGDGCGLATSSDPTVCLSSCSKHGPLYMIHSQRPYLHCKYTVSLIWTRLWKEC